MEAQPLCCGLWKALGRNSAREGRNTVDVEKLVHLHESGEFVGKKTAASLRRTKNAPRKSARKDMQLEDL